MKYQLVDLQYQGWGERHKFKTKREVWEYLVYCFECSEEIDEPRKWKLNDLLEVGCFNLIKLKK